MKLKLMSLVLLVASVGGLCGMDKARAWGKYVEGMGENPFLKDKEKKELGTTRFADFYKDLNSFLAGYVCDATKPTYAAKCIFGDDVSVVFSPIAIADATKVAEVARVQAFVTQVGGEILDAYEVTTSGGFLRQLSNFFDTARSSYSGLDVYLKNKTGDNRFLDDKSVGAKLPRWLGKLHTVLVDQISKINKTITAPQVANLRIRLQEADSLLQEFMSTFFDITWK